MRRWIAVTAAVGIMLGAGGPSAFAQGTSDTPDDDTLPAFAPLMGSGSPAEAKPAIDFGPGRGLGRGKARVGRTRAAGAVRAAAAMTPTGSSDAGFNGLYGPPVPWPIIPIHVALLPDGRVMSYGTDLEGVRGGQLYYDVWDPSLGLDESAHMVLPNTTRTDIFCSYQALLWTTGDLVVMGGDHRPERVGASQAAVELFNAPSNSIAPTAAMTYPRWYGTLVAMPDGRMLALGGRQGVARGANIPANTPELLDPATGWRALPNATSGEAFFDKSNWFYPRAAVAPNGQVFIPAISGDMFLLDPGGDGTLVNVGKTRGARPSQPMAMFAPGKLLALRGLNQASVFDLNGTTPVVTPTASLSQARYWSNATVLADGQVLINGGSSVSNKLAGIAYQNETWNPATGQFTLGAIAAKPRLYHSSALLLPDATVLTAGGGSPGPVANLNAEIFYPPYLFLNDGSGTPAPRPVVTADSAVVRVGQAITATVGVDDVIARLTLVKFGAVTHAMNIDQRFIELPFTRTDQTLAATLPDNPNVLMPGYYMLFALNAAGTPSVASTILVLPQG